MSTHQLLSVQSIDRLTPSSVAISFEVPAALQADFAFKAGQYLSLETTINGAAVRRSYSLCSAPHECTLTVGIKQVPQGVFSTHANEVIKVGDQLGVAPPEGRFVYVPNGSEGEILLIAAGSGITPVFSILKTALAKQANTKVRLVYGNKSPEEVMFKAELEALEKEHAGQFKVHWVYSQSNEANALFGRVDKSVVNYALNQAEALPDQVFLCGPEGMIETAKESLEAAKVATENIHFELFTSATAVASSEAKADGQVELLITADGEDFTLATTEDKTILDAALNQKIDVPYSCQGGVCCSCIARVTEGSAKMDNNQILTDDEVAEGLVLNCQALPTSAKVKNEYDDV